MINNYTIIIFIQYLNSRITRNNKNDILFGEKLRNETEFEIIKCLTKYISHWCSLCIYHYPHEDQLKNTVYTFFEKVSYIKEFINLF